MSTIFRIVYVKSETTQVRGVAYVHASDQDCAEDLAIEVGCGGLPEGLIEHLPEPADVIDDDVVVEIDQVNELTPREALALFGGAAAASVPATRMDHPQ